LSARGLRSRGQSNVVGVAILLGVTVVALGTLTASVGTIVDQHAAASDSRRVASDLDESLRPVETTGVRRGTVAFTSGELELVERDVHLLNSSGVVARVDANALRFSSGSRGATYLAGSVLVHGNDWSRTRQRMPVTADPNVLVVSVPALRGNVSLAATGGASYTLRSNVSHHRRNLGRETYRVAVETTSPAAWKRQFERANATVYERDIDDDGVPSVVADFEGSRTAYLVVHEVEVSVS
jgi:flagellin-like protein